MGTTHDGSRSPLASRWTYYVATLMVGWRSVPLDEWEDSEMASAKLGIPPRESIESGVPISVSRVIRGEVQYALVLGDSQEILRRIPNSSIDCMVTSPPYWKQREYSIDEDKIGFLIGQEDRPEAYVSRLVETFREAKRVLKPTGSLWLNIGDKYHGKNLLGLPWRVAIALQTDGWILRNDVIWEKLKGTESVKNRLRHTYEHIFHFVKSEVYYYDADSIRIKPRRGSTILNGKPTSATGVSGTRYRQQIQASTHLSPRERIAAIEALDVAIQEMREHKIVDFRMTIRGQQRILHSDRGSVSGRAKELEARGYFILKSPSKGFIPSDIWRIVPEDEGRTDNHYAVFPSDLLRIPILATCPPGGVVLDPFSGQGSTLVAAVTHDRHGIGIDLSKNYLTDADKRLRLLRSASGPEGCGNRSRESAPKPRSPRACA